MLKIGHRGLPGYPRKGENTIRSFEAALAAGADGLEFDIRKTKDGQLAVIHDATVDRTTNGHGKVCDLSYAELSKFDAGFGEPIPLLSTVLEKFGGKCLLNIELKESDLGEVVKAEIVKRGLHKLPYLRSVLVSAFDKHNDYPGSSSWDELKIFVPEIPIALIVEASKIEKLGEAGLVQKAKEYGAKAINPESTCITVSFVELAHKENLLLYAWTVNDPENAQKLKDIGVDGIHSDCVDRI